MDKDNLTEKQTGPDGRSKYAVFLPALSGFYGTFIGKQRVNNDYVDPARMPAHIKDMEQLNWLNSQRALFPYKWSLYSAGHADLDLTKDAPAEDMVRDRASDTFILGDSGGFQIAKGLWVGDWKANSGCPKAQKYRSDVLTWLDSISDYGMILDIPTWVVRDKKSSKACGITTIDEAVDATKFNNEYFMANRKGVKNGGAKFLNVLQGANHSSADQWYDEMKKYCDPTIYPDTHFDGWAMGGQNMCDVHLILKRLVAMRHDNLLQEGVHDWMHFLGTSKLEWALLLTDIQTSVRKYVNPNFTISFDCASPFLATANGQVYHDVGLEHNKKWSYLMAPSADDKKYATDTRLFRDALLQDKILGDKNFIDSPVSANLLMKEICIYGPGTPNLAALKPNETPDPLNPAHWLVMPDANKNGKVGRTSWDSFSYALMMGHNVWTHLYAVQEANRRYEKGEYPGMMQYSKGNMEMFKDIVDAIFATSDRAEAEAIIEHFGGPTGYWTEIIGGRGFIGKKAVNAHTQVEKHLQIEGTHGIDKVVKAKKVAGKPVLSSLLFDGEDLDEHPVDDSGLDETPLDLLEKDKE